MIKLSQLIIFICLIACVYTDQNPESEGSSETPGNKKEQEKKPRSETETFLEGFLPSIASIIASEIGDKTFILAAIMAMKYNRIIIFTAAASALVVMTALSCSFGYLLPMLISKTYTTIFATILFYGFGFYQIYDWKYGKKDENEAENVEQELSAFHDKLIGQDAEEQGELEGEATTGKFKMTRKDWVILWQCFSLTFLNEWGDRSQFSTIALAAVHDAHSVFVGGSIGHLFCTSLAVLGGKLLSNKIPEKTVTLIGGIIFIVFGLMYTVQLLFGMGLEEQPIPPTT